MDRRLAYRFGEYRFDPTARELRHHDQLLELPRLIFAALTFLVENRDRAVSRDELIEAVWDRPFVEDIQVSQLIMRLRRTIGDDSQEPRFVRTVPGFGYRWIAETEERPGSAAKAEPDRSILPRHRWLQAGVLTTILILIAILVFRADTRNPDGLSPLVREPGQAIAVLPMTVESSNEGAGAWVRLGAMDLVAGRLRDTGLPIPPSDSVVAAWHASEGLDESLRPAALRRTLGAGVLVHGTARSERGAWTVELVAVGSGDDRRRVTAGPADIIAAVSQASDLLLAAFGQPVEATTESDTTVSELLHRARAATLALELDRAREILAEAPVPLRDEPEIRYERVWVEYRAGRLEETERLLIELLDDPRLATRPRLHAGALSHRGIVIARREDSWVAAMPYFDAAVAILDQDPWAPELGIMLAARGMAQVYQHQFDAAALDLGRARSLFQVAGDRLGLARFHNHFGGLELERRRPLDALPHFQTAIDISQSFGHTDWLRGNLIGLLIAHTQLLDWPGALASSERLWTLRERIADPVWNNQITAYHATVLLAFGRLTEAEQILADSGEEQAGLPPQAVREREQVRARLAWRQGRSEPALDAAEKALALWPASDSPAAQERSGLALLHQRASIAIGRPTPAAPTPLFASATPDPEQSAAVAGEQSRDDATYLVARAEWAAHMGDGVAAEQLFRRAATEAEEQAVPATLALVADAYARWLLAMERVPEALALAGRIAGWAEHDYDSALLLVAVFHASGFQEAWGHALQNARRLAGERVIPADLLRTPD